ncbi:uncharacterized protein [Fopius arisanus]|uniref:Uncharacterized protein isoform X2 n=1 Tax=Fopius arisanus TaxID=64838 RepID=A0A9R1T282_9HYME|nr:PREDICTED: uncharacterized protein LOC105265790 isoform X2 [Fopius arisanus]
MSNEGSDSSDVDQPAYMDTGEASELPPESPLLMKSREQYQTLYRKFMEWRDTNEKGPLSEDVFMDYFTDLAEKMKPSTLWSQYSMLKATMIANEKLDMNEFYRLRGFLKTKSIGYKKKTSNTFTSRQIEQFLTDAPDSQYLAEKVALVFGILGGCRSHELVHISVDNIEDDGSMALVTIPKTESDPERSFSICGEFYQVYKKYASLRPKKTDCRRFFLNYRGGKCVNQVIGLHKFGGMPKLIASYLNAPDPDGYTGHSFRRTSASLLAESGADYRSLQRHAGWNSKIARDLMEEKKRNQVRLAKQITESVFLKPSTSTSNDNFQIEAPREETLAPPEQSPIVDDPLFIDCSTAIKEEITLDEVAEEQVPAQIKMPVLAQKPNIFRKPVKPPILRPVATPPIKIAPKPVIRIQPKNVLPTPFPNQNPSTKRLVVKTISVQRPPVVPPLQPQSSTSAPETQRSPEVCLRWGFHHNNMQTSFPHFLNSEEFVDVTLACEGKSVKCHKVILSACSDYLASLLRENPCQHPIILMKDLKFWEVAALVKFMYEGEVNILHDKLPQLLKAANALQIKGLVNFAPQQNKDQPPLASASVCRPEAPAAPPKTHEIRKPKHLKNLSTASPAFFRRAIKRPLLMKRPSLVSKYRRETPKTPPPRESSPEIKMETLDIPLGDADLFSVSPEYENLITLDEASPGEGRPPEVPGHDMDMVLTDYLQPENNFLEKMDDVDNCGRSAEIEEENGQPPGDDDQHELHEEDGT